MIAKEAVDRLIIQLQQLATDYDEHVAFAAQHAKDKAERDTIARELQQFRLALSDLKLEYQNARQQLGQVNADITRRSQELQVIDQKISQAKARAFGG
jgi:hypothetical protein